MTSSSQSIADRELSSLTKHQLLDLADGLLTFEPLIIERCVDFVVAETHGFWHGRARAIMCRRLKHCYLEEIQRTKLLNCIFSRLSTGKFSEQFKDQLRLSLHIAPEESYKVAANCLCDLNAKPHIKRYAEWLLAH